MVRRIKIISSTEAGAEVNMVNKLLAEGWNLGYDDGEAISDYELHEQKRHDESTVKHGEYAVVLTRRQEISKRFWQRVKVDPERLARHNRYVREWRRTHPLTEEQRENYRVQKRGWRERNRDKTRAKERWAGRKRAGTQNLNRTKICSQCGEQRQTEGCHIIPRWLTHDDSSDNVIETCKSCHKTMEIFVLNFLAGRYNDGYWTKRIKYV